MVFSSILLQCSLWCSNNPNPKLPCFIPHNSQVPKKMAPPQDLTLDYVPLWIYTQNNALTIHSHLYTNPICRHLEGLDQIKYFMVFPKRKSLASFPLPHLEIRHYAFSISVPSGQLAQLCEHKNCFKNIYLICNWQNSYEKKKTFITMGKAIEEDREKKS